MIRSLYAGVSGMKNHQVRMDTVGNNIANVNTTGYKAGRVNFQDTLYQTVRSGGDGRNPAQVGSGMSVGSISNDFTQGGLQNTGRTLDLAIDGNGFFIVKDEAGNQFFTRDGVFYLDDQGYMVNGDGLRVQSAQGDIRVYNGPVSTLTIGPDGAISGTNTSGEPLQMSSTPVKIPEPTKVDEAELIGESLGEIKPEVTATGSLSGDAINAAVAPVEAKAVGTSDGVESLGITSSGIDLDTKNLEISLDGGSTFTTVDMSGVTGVTSWQDLADKLQQAVDSTAGIQNSIEVIYDKEAYGGLVFKTKNTPVDGTVPKIEVSGTDVTEFMGNGAVLSDEGEAGQTKDWTGKTITFNVGEGWHTITTDASTGLDSVTSGENLAAKLQSLINVEAGGTAGTILDNYTAMTVSSGTPTGDVEIKGIYNGTTDETLTVQKTATGWSIDGGTSDILTDASGETTFTYKGMTVDISSVSLTTDGDAWDYNLKTLSGYANVDVSWDNDHLVFTPTNSNSEITLGGPDIAGFIGTGAAATESNIDWTNKDISINYNGTTYNFSQYEKEAAGLSSITDGSALANALNNMIDSKIGSDKVDVTWSDSSSQLKFETKGTTGIGIQPSIHIGGADAADFVGSKQSAKGLASTQPPTPSQEPANVIRLASFSNPEGLLKAGKGLYKGSESSGTAAYGAANTPGFGTINSSYLEASNVDLTEEFTNMITTQRGYQANSRVITTSDRMLEELINLKR
ncbi:MAG: flagellar hook-basal body complex protein [Firmicutes bacterium]|nr:flagellar hook-basal body complex protein [Bacillota bacterium]